MESVEEIVEILKTELGPLGSTLWESAIKQQIINGTFDIGLGCLLLFVGIVCVYLTVKFRDTIDDHPGTMFTALGAIIGFLFGLMLLKTGVSQIYNPEWHAIQAIIYLI